MIDLAKSYEVFQPEKFRDAIHIIGCGSVGGAIAEQLVRCGITRFTLWDFDKVEAHNLANQVFRQKDVGRMKAEALLDILCEINDDVRKNSKVKLDGWKGEQVSGFVFLCADSMEVRKGFCTAHLYNQYVKWVADHRTELYAGQYYSADWSVKQQRENLLASMDFTDEEGLAATPTSACGTVLGVVPTVRALCALSVADFMNFWNGKPPKKFARIDPFSGTADSFSW